MMLTFLKQISSTKNLDTAEQSNCITSLRMAGNGLKYDVNYTRRYNKELGI
jgi:hypothetical protein